MSDKVLGFRYVCDLHVAPLKYIINAACLVEKQHTTIL